MIAKQKILIVEDDPAIQRGLRDALRSEGYQTLEASDGPSGKALAIQADADLLLLDLVLPGASGFEILGAVREVRPTLPVIILTARGEEPDRIQGLRRGADDYVVKPFSVQELLARVAAVLRRTPERPADLATIDFPGCSADLNRREIAYGDGGREPLSDREMELLRYLALNSGRAISREELLAHVWRMDPQRVVTRTIDVHIARLRIKLRDDQARPRILLTVHGKGYMLARDGAERAPA